MLNKTKFENQTWDQWRLMASELSLERQVFLASKGRTGAGVAGPMHSRFCEWARVGISFHFAS
jgi:hypothetical protein